MVDPSLDPDLTRKDKEKKRLARRERHMRHPAPVKAANPESWAQLWAATISTWLPWRRGEYPGYARAASLATGINIETMQRWMSRGATKPRPEAMRAIASALRAKGDTLLALAAAWEREAVIREGEEKAAIRRPFRDRRLAEQDGWRAKPR